MARIAVLVLVVAVLAWVGLRVAEEFGVFKHYYKHHPGPCRKVNNAEQLGSEDVHVTKSGLTFITSGLDMRLAGPQFKEYLKRNNVKGKILALDLSKPGDGAKDLPLKSTADFDVNAFRPHGISVLEDNSNGNHLLYVVNHPPGEKDRVEKFRYVNESQQLEHLKTFSSEKFNTLNDLTVVKEDVFYVTNYMYFSTPLKSMFETIGPFSLGDIALVDGSRVSVVVPSLKGPNGINLSPDGRHVYLNLPHLRKMAVYTRDQSNNSLTLTQTVDLHTMPDNSHFSPSGNALIAGCHPIFAKLSSHFTSPDTIKAPSHVLYIPLSSDGQVIEEEISQLFYDHGDLISGSSVGAIYNDLLLVGSIAHNLVLCDLKGASVRD